MSGPQARGRVVAAKLKDMSMNRIARTMIGVAGTVVCLAGPVLGAGDYPMSLTADAKATAGTAAVTAPVTIKVDRLMEESRRKRVTDRLEHDGYAKFVPELRALPPVGTIEVQGRSVEIRYAREQRDEKGRRVVLIADRPLFFIGADPAKNRAGYELTIVELRFDAAGGFTGTMAGAAKVKTSPDGPILDDFAQAPVTLTPRRAKP
jgi:hypothetical protein